MIIIMKSDAAEAQIEEIVKRVEDLGFAPHFLRV